MYNRAVILLSIGIVVIFSACSSANKISSGYYHKNAKVLDQMEVLYKELYRQKPFALQFTDKTFEEVSIDILTDSVKFVYVFNLGEKARMNDTLQKYGINTSGVSKLAGYMKAIKCNWINNLDYYVDATKQNLIFISIRPVEWTAPFSPPKYYIVTYFSTQQYFDKQGRLLDKRRTRRLRKINGDIFYRITDKVCYTVSASFR
jgi:hypothetical protein